MNPFIDTVDKASAEIDRLQKLLKKSTARQVQSKDEREVLKAVAITWFQTHREFIVDTLNEKLVTQVDVYFQQLLKAADKSPLRLKCLEILKQARLELHKVRNENITVVTNTSQKTIDTIPNFSSAVSDPDMQKILAARWDECIKCVEVNAPLAAVVMMGGLLETLLLNRINKLPNQAAVFTAKSAPRHKGQPLPLKEWALKNYIEVAHELTWITQTEKDLGVVLRDYRNFIHPFKQKSYSIFLTQNDARILWELCKSISKQLI